MKSLLLLFTLVILAVQAAWAQCAMCKAGVETSLENSSEMTSINNGVLYALFFAFAGVSFFAYLIYKNSKA